MMSKQYFTKIKQLTNPIHNSRMYVSDSYPFNIRALYSESAEILIARASRVGSRRNTNQQQQQQQQYTDGITHTRLYGTRTCLTYVCCEIYICIYNIQRSLFSPRVVFHQWFPPPSPCLASTRVLHTPAHFRRA